MDKFTAKYEQHYGGIHIEYHFENGYGLSVIMHDGSYGRQRCYFEVAVVKKDSKDNWFIYKDHNIFENSDDVLGWQSFGDVQHWLDKISAM